MYALLATDAYAARVSWARVHVFWSDERCVPPADPSSNYRMAREALLDRVAIPAANVHRIAGEAEPDRAAAAYEDELKQCLGDGRFDLVLLGMGKDGHTASLFPGTAAIGETRKWVVAVEVTAVPPWRITLTPPPINAAAAVMFLVQGADKAATLHRVLEGPHDTRTAPAQVVAPHDGEVEWLVDAPAAADLARS
jgi:6-phosphogluconolactonase